MALNIYILVSLAYFVHLVIKLNSSVFKFSLTYRLLKSLILALFWFVSIPLSLFNGRLLKPQLELDKEMFNYYKQIEIDKLIISLRKIESGFDEETVRKCLNKSVGTFENLINEEKKHGD